MNDHSVHYYVVYSTGGHSLPTFSRSSAHGLAQRLKAQGLPVMAVLRVRPKRALDAVCL